MGILLRGQEILHLAAMDMLYWLKLLGFFKRRVGGGGEVLIVKLDNVKACNEECHSVSTIYFVISYYSRLKTNNSAIFFAM